MPLVEQPNAAARVYARSYFDLAFARGGREQVEHDLSELEEIVELTRQFPRFGAFLAHPAIATGQRRATLEKIFKGRVSEDVYSLLHVLNDKGRVNAFPAVVAAIDECLQEKFGRVEVDAFSAAPLSGGEVEALGLRLSAALGKNIVVHNYAQPAMIGGLKLKIGDQLLDASISSRLRSMKDRIHKEGGAALRARIGKIIEG